MEDNFVCPTCGHYNPPTQGISDEHQIELINIIATKKICMDDFCKILGVESLQYLPDYRFKEAKTIAKLSYDKDK